jgi:hypothetical protein
VAAGRGGFGAKDDFPLLVWPRHPLRTSTNKLTTLAFTPFDKPSINSIQFNANCRTKNRRRDLPKGLEFPRAKEPGLTKRVNLQIRTVGIV